jgi:hypothetical protein
MGIKRGDSSAFIYNKFLGWATIRVVNFFDNFNAVDAWHVPKATRLIYGSLLLEGAELCLDAPPVALLGLDLKQSNPGHD